MLNILTLDIEDWYQSSVEILDREETDIVVPVPPGERVVTNTQRVLHILAESGVHVTCFVLGTVAEKYPNLVREIYSAGHDVATHGYGHELVYKITPEEFRADIQHSIRLLESIIGKKVEGYRAPYFSITKTSAWALEILSDLGILYDSSIFPIRRKIYGFPGCNRFPYMHGINCHSLLELPISTIGILGGNFPVGGGGYLRLLPYALIRQAIKLINNEGQPAVFYLHPYELDTEELSNPLPNESWKTHFVRYTQGLNRKKTEYKLRRLLEDFKWTSAKEWMKDRS